MICCCCIDVTMEYGYLLCILTVLISPPRSYGQGTCIKKNDCVCEFSDGSRINLESLGKKGSFAFPYQKDQSVLGGYEYAYNPCYPVSDTEDCKDVAACQRDPNTGDHYSIGDATSAQFLGSDDSITIGYSSTDQHGTPKVLTVTLICEKTATKPTLVVQGEDPEGNSYKYSLTSECCCPDGCVGGPPPTPTKSGGLSGGSILCIAFACIVSVYLISGVMFMKFVKHAEGKEIIPNYSFWTELPALIKGGCMFTYSKFKQLLGKGDPSYDKM